MQRDDHRPLYNKIHEVAEELMKHPKATDVSEIKTMMTNIELNWDCLDTALAKRLGNSIPLFLSPSLPPPPFPFLSFSFSPSLSLLLFLFLIKSKPGYINIKAEN